MTTTQVKVRFTKQTILGHSVKEGVKNIKIQAEVIGDYAVHKSLNQANSISITHVPTGFVVLWYEAISPKLYPSPDAEAQNKLEAWQTGWIASCFIDG